MCFCVCVCVCGHDRCCRAVAAPLTSGVLTIVSFDWRPGSQCLRSPPLYPADPHLGGVREGPGGDTQWLLYTPTALIQ
ncbi:unnamed protein product [Colias eurytheme]|nr:unnamed protein product [Colias eurytheme]